jgi:phage FluMu protein Com
MSGKKSQLSYPMPFVDIRCVVCNKKLAELKPLAGYKLLCRKCKTLHVYDPDKIGA